MRLRNVLTLLLIVVLFAPMTNTPAVAQQTPAQLSFVWFAHVGTDAPAVDIYFVDSATPIVTNLSFGAVTSMYAFPSNKRGLVMRAAGSPADSSPIYTGNWSLTPNQSYLILATGLLSKRAFVLNPVVLVRNNMRGQARLRMLNVISGSPLMRFLDENDAIIGPNLGYLQPVDVMHTPGASTIALQNQKRLNEIITTEAIDFKADTLYVALITGDAVDTFPIDVQTLEFPQELTRVKVVNHSNMPYNVILKRSSEENSFAPDLAPGASSDYIEVPSGAASFLVKRSASDDNREITSSALQLRPSRDVTLTIDGTGTNIDISISSETLMAGIPIAGQAADATATPEATP